MTGRDRIVLVVLAAIAVIALAWIEVVSPERKRASTIEAQVSSAEVALSSARTKLAGAQEAEKRFSAAYSSLVSLGEAVPAAEEVSSLVYAVDRAAGRAHVEFESISSGGGSSSASAVPSTAAGAASASFRQLPFTFTFAGSFFDLYDMMRKLERFTLTTSSGTVQVSGRLLTVDGLSLAAASSASSGSSRLTGTVTVTAYVLPAAETPTAGATSAGPAGVGTSPASSAGAPSPSAPAVVKAGP
ncbi:MAG: hypothetical protein ACYCUM_04710 [Solirubrobacteraceae bacterium]